MINILIFVLYIIFNNSVIISDNIKLNINNKPVDIIAISPPHLQVYHSVNKYSKIYNIPKQYMFRMLEEETNYINPLNIRYVHTQTSKANAEGPAQLLLKTARWISKNNMLTRYDIRTNIELNIELSAKFIQWIYNNKTQNWGKVFNYYNTGYTNRINRYAKNIVRMM